MDAETATIAQIKFATHAQILALNVPIHRLVHHVLVEMFSKDLLACPHVIQDITITLEFVYNAHLDAHNVKLLRVPCNAQLALLLIS